VNERRVRNRTRIAPTGSIKEKKSGWKLFGNYRLCTGTEQTPALQANGSDPVAGGAGEGKKVNEGCEEDDDGMTGEIPLTNYHRSREGSGSDATAPRTSVPARKSGR
jgi:hypothetical protein